MATRTLQFLGMAFGDSTASITVTANGNQIFSGTVATQNQPVPALPNYDLLANQIVLFTYEIDTAFVGQIPMTCTVNNGTVIFGEVMGNYARMPNPVYSTEQYQTLANPASTRSQRLAIWTQVATPPFSAEELATLENPATTRETVQQITDAHGCSLIVDGDALSFGQVHDTDARSNVFINGVEQFPNYTELGGTWWWTLASGSTMSYNLEIQAGIV